MDVDHNYQSIDKTFIKSLLNSNDLSDILNNKLEKYTNIYKKTKIGLKRQNTDTMSVLEEGYESSDSEDNNSNSTKNTNTSNSIYSSFISTSSDISSVNSDIKSLSKENIINNDIQYDIFLKIKTEINDLKTFIPSNNNDVNTIKNDISGDKNNKNIDSSNDNKNDDKENKKKNIYQKKKTRKVVELYPLEFYEIFPKLKKFEVSYHSSNQDFIEKPLFFIKNFILKNYHDSLLFTQNKFELQKFKNSSTDYNYEIMNISQPMNKPANNDCITCMLQSHYFNSPDKKNPNIVKISTFISKLIQIKTSFQINFFYFGYKNGTIMQYTLLDIKADPLSGSMHSAETFSLYREYKVDDIIKDSNKKHVLCMSLSDDEYYLLAGYASRHIIVWDTIDGTQIFNLDDIFDKPVISCEFLSITDDKEFIFLVGDLYGKVRMVQYNRNTFIDTHETRIVSNCTYPCLLIKRLKLNKRENEEDYDLKKMIKKINKKNVHICFIGNLEYIELLMISKNSLKIMSVLVIKNPDLFKLNPITELIKRDRTQFYSQSNLMETMNNIEFPDVCFGVGFLGDLIKNNDNKEPFILFVVAWKLLIRLYYFSKELSRIDEIGWYVNNSPIIKIGFIGTSLLYLIDKNNNVKIINVKLFNKKTNNNTDSNIDYYKKMKNKFLIPLSDITTIENPIKTISNDFNLATYYYSPFIINTKYNIYLMQENKEKKSNINNITRIHLLSFVEFFNEVLKKEEWNLFFCKYIDLLKTNTNNFGFIPENKEKKEKLLIDKKEKLVKFDYLGCYLKQNFSELEEDFEKDYSFLSIGIEFAIEIGSIDYIYNEVKKLKKEKKFEDKLVFQLEPFILNNKFQSNPDLISGDLISEIINYYTTSDDDSNLIIEEENDKLFKLDLILCHLNIEIVKKIKTVEDIIKKNDLYCSLIYYYSNGLNDFKQPLEYLFEHFNKVKATEFPKESIYSNYFKKAKNSRGYYRDNYNELIKGLIKGFKTDVSNLKNNLFKSKEFIGHLLLFYIQLTLKGIYFPNVGRIPLETYNKVIPELFLFLTRADVAIKLISFDCLSYFETLTLFFIREDEINKIIDDELSVQNYSDMNNDKESNELILKKEQLCPLVINDINIDKLKSNIKGYKEHGITPDKKIDDLKQNIDCLLELIYNIKKLCENQKIFQYNILIKFDLYIFIIKISLIIDNISEDILYKVLTAIFDFHSEIKNIKNSMDQNSFSLLMEKIDKFSSHYSLIKNRQSNLDELSSIINIVIKKYYIKNNPNNEVINNLLKICKQSHFLGVKIYLYELKKEYIRCINVFYENRKISRRVFTFIEKTLNLLKDSKDEKNFQTFKNEIKRNISNLAGVSNSETFKIIHNWFNSKDIIANLNNLPELQLKYLDKIRVIYRKKLKDEKQENRNDSLKKEYSEILTSYIKLLLSFKKDQRILKILKSEEEYINVKECLKLCLNKSIDASVYLYMLTGDDKNALEICLEKIKSNFEDIKTETNNYDKFLILFDEIKKLISQCITICESTSESSALYYKGNNDMVGKKKNDVVMDDPGDEYWLNLFGTLYNILNETEKNNSAIFYKLRSYLTQKVESLLLTMSYYVDFGYILKNVSNELEFSLLKKFLNRIFFTKSYFSNLYTSYITLLSSIINKDMKIIELKEQNGKNVRLTGGESIENEIEKRNAILDRFNKNKFEYNYKKKESNDNSSKNNNIIKDDIKKNEEKMYKKCFICSKNLNFIDKNLIKDENELIIFKCDHIYHMNCLANEYNKIKKKYKNNIRLRENVCPECINIQTEIFALIDSDAKFKKNKNEINFGSDYSYTKIDSSATDKRKNKLAQKQKNKKIKALNLFDNKYFEQIDIIQSTLGGI